MARLKMRWTMRRRSEPWEMEIDFPETCPECGGDNSGGISGFCSQACEERYVDDQRRCDEEYARDLQLEIQEYPPDVVRKIMGGC